MKRMIAITAVLCALLLLASCGAPASGETTGEDSGISENAAEIETDIAAGHISSSYVGWTEDERIKTGEENGDSGFSDGQKHFPVFVFNSTGELTSFKENFSTVLQFDGTRDGIPSFNEVTKTYDDAFFEENALAAVYVTSGSGSFRYGVRGVYIKDDLLTVEIEQLNDPETYTADMAGWLLTAGLDKSALADVTAFDAVFVGKSADCGSTD